MLNTSGNLLNVQHLVQQYTMTAILETYVTGTKAELFFCRYVEGTRRFFIHGMRFLCRKLGPTISIQLSSQLLMVSLSL